jgi:hypothetical protein
MVMRSFPSKVSGDKDKRQTKKCQAIGFRTAADRRGQEIATQLALKVDVRFGSGLPSWFGRLSGTKSEGKGACRHGRQPLMLLSVFAAPFKIYMKIASSLRFECWKR